jgi:TonB family protein
LGITLLEALTQHPLAREGTEPAELVLPETLPEPFFDIASHCLRRDPQRRWTVAEIKTRLQQSLPALQGRETVPIRRGFTKWGYLFLVVAAGLLLAILGPRVLHHQPDSKPGPSGAVESAAGAPAPQPETRAGQATQISRGKEQSPARSHAAARADVTKNSVSNNSSGTGAQGAVARKILPDVSRNALRTIQGKLKVRVKVAVDSSGNVTGARFDSRGPSRYFADRSLRAAKQWTFKPPQVNGQSVPSEWVLRFEFERTGTNVHPTQTSP